MYVGLHSSRAAVATEEQPQVSVSAAAFSFHSSISVYSQFCCFHRLYGHPPYEGLGHRHTQQILSRADVSSIVVRSFVPTHRDEIEVLSSGILP